MPAVCGVRSRDHIGRNACSKGKSEMPRGKAKVSKVTQKMGISLPVQSETLSPGTDSRKAGHLAVVQGSARQTRSAPNPETGMTEKQEAFCQGVTSGLSLSDAYRAAYDTANMLPASVHRQACAMFGSPKIAARIKAIVDDMAEKRRMLSASDADLALSVFRRLAEKADTDASRIRAAELLAKAAGVFVEQIETTDKTDRAEQDLEASIKARLQRLGLAG